ncbi:hypothetical protein YC2023_019413 [Brassica napus]
MGAWKSLRSSRHGTTLEITDKVCWIHSIHIKARIGKMEVYDYIVEKNRYADAEPYRDVEARFLEKLGFWYVLKTNIHIYIYIYIY